MTPGSSDNPIVSSGPLYPIRLRISDESGKSLTIDIVSDEQLYGIGVRFTVRLAMMGLRKIVMEDCCGLCVFHAEDGRILFPTQEQLRRTRG